MLKRIGVHQLLLGMHIKEFCGSWMEHPFLRTSFVLTNPKDVEAILASSIQEVWIDCSKGLDVADGQGAVSEADSTATAETELIQAARGPRQTAPSFSGGRNSARIPDLSAGQARCGQYV